MDANQSLIYRIACQIRCFETAIAEAANSGFVPGLVHLCTGAEVLQATLCTALLGHNDYVTGSHRSHGLAIGMGADPYAVAAEIFGKASGLSGGFGGTQHLAAPDCGFLTSNGIVGAQVPLAAGAALSNKILRPGNIGVCFFGDGAANQGAVLETMNLAVALELPLLFILENNGLGQSTSSHYASGGVSFSARAKGFGLRTEIFQEKDIADQMVALPLLIEEVRTSGKPLFLEAFVPRLSGHYHGEEKSFTAGEKDMFDPLTALEGLLERSGLIQDKEGYDFQIEIQDAVARALKSATPETASLTLWEQTWQANS